MKINRKTAGALIFAALVLLLFFSRTIYNYNLPQVTGTKPFRGTLSKIETSSGVARWADTENIYAASSGTAGRVYVREGDTVEKDQILFEMDFNITQAQRRLSEIDNNISKSEADIKSLETRLKSVHEALAAINTEGNSAAAPDNASPDSALIIFEINKALVTLHDAQVSFNFGMMSGNEFANAQNNYRSLLYKYEAEIESLEHNIALKRLDLATMKLSRDTSADLLQNYTDNAIIRAPADGVILELNVERGKYFNENAMLVSIGTGSGFMIECNISIENNFVNQGDTCRLSNSNHTLTGIVRRIRSSANSKTVTIFISPAIEAENARFSYNQNADFSLISDGETFDITFEKTGVSSFTLVPNRAINQDNDGYFIYQIKRRAGFLGQEYYIERLNIFIGDSDYQNTAVIRGITFFEPVVLAGDKPLSGGLTVLLKNAEDFFEN